MGGTAAIFAFGAALALAAPAGAQTMAAAEGSKEPNVFAIKLGVAEFQRTTDFYVKYFGMKEGATYPAETAEKSLVWPEPGHGATIIMYRDDCPGASAADKAKRAAAQTSPVLRKLKGCTHPFERGSSWLAIRVADIRATEKALNDGGAKVTVGDAGRLGVRSYVILTEDPDGNILEITQNY